MMVMMMTVMVTMTDTPFPKYLGHSWSWLYPTPWILPGSCTKLFGLLTRIRMVIYWWWWLSDDYLMIIKIIWSPCCQETFAASGTGGGGQDKVGGSKTTFARIGQLLIWRAVIMIDMIWLWLWREPAARSSLSPVPHLHSLRLTSARQCSSYQLWNICLNLGQGVPWVHFDVTYTL